MEIQRTDSTSQGCRDVTRLLWFCRRKKMSGPHPNLWARLLLAALLSVTLPGSTGESTWPCRPLWGGAPLTGPLQTLGGPTADHCAPPGLENLRLCAPHSGESRALLGGLALRRRSLLRGGTEAPWWS